MTKKLKILVTNHLDDTVLGPLRELAVVTQWGKEKFDLMPREAVLNVISDVYGIINHGELLVDEELLNSAPQLKIVANASIGYDNLNLDVMSRYGVRATNAPGHFAQPLAEFVMGGILALSRNLIKADRFVRSGEWDAFQPGRWDGYSLRGSVMGIVGLGNTGLEVARLATCMGMKVIYCNRKTTSDNLPFHHVTFDALIEAADVVSVHVQLTPETTQMFCYREFCQMKDTAIFVNVSRGRVVNEADVIKALRESKIAGAVLDVFADEPFVPEALREMSNVLLTPHIAGGSTQARRSCNSQAVMNVIEMITHGKPTNLLQSSS